MKANFGPFKPQNQKFQKNKEKNKKKEEEEERKEERRKKVQAFALKSDFCKIFELGR